MSQTLVKAPVRLVSLDELDGLSDEETSRQLAKIADEYVIRAVLKVDSGICRRCDGPKRFHVDGMYFLDRTVSVSVQCPTCETETQYRVQAGEVSGWLAVEKLESATA